VTWAPTTTLAELAAGGLFSDGDWVESKDQDPSGSVRLTQLADIGVGEFRDRSDRWLRIDQAAALRCTFLEPGDVLIARMPDPIGRACLAPPTIGTAVTAVDVSILRIRRPDIDPRYVMWAINAPRFHAEVEARQSGTTRKRISRKNLGGLAIPLPPLDEQRRIVALLEDHLSRLDAADAYVRSATQRLANAERSALERLFGGRDVPLADLVKDISAGKSYGAANAPAADDEWGIIKVSAMTWGKFDPTENKAVPSERADPRFEIQEGDLLVSRANTDEYVGASVLVGPVRTKLLLSDKSLRLSPTDGVRPDWLWRALQAPSARRQISALATGTKDSMRNISQASLMRVNVPRATPQEQATAVSSYAEIAAAFERLRTGVDSASRRSEGLHRSLLAAAFSGQLTAETATA
jgi:type I restriction enzyme, S subunit